MATASRTRLVLASIMVGGAAALAVVPGGAAQVLPLPLPVPSPSVLPTATPTAIPGPGVQGVQPPQPPSAPQICKSSEPAAPPSCAQVGEPHIPAAHCTMPPLGPSEFRVVSDLVPSPQWWWGASLAVDPSNPCHLYTGASAMNNIGGGYPQTVFRGDTVNGVTSWAPVFTVPTQPEDSLPLWWGAPNQRFTRMQALPAVGPTGTVWLAATTDGSVGLTRVFRSNDVGAHWDERDNGFLTQTPNAQWASTLVAPSDPRTAYVVTPPRFATGPTPLHATHDGGATWSTAALPDAGGTNAYGLVARLAVDPADATSLFFIPPSSNTLWLSSDGGMTWRLRVGTGAQLPPPNAGPDGNTESLVVTHPPGRGVQLYVHASNQWWGSADQGASWYGLLTPADEGTGSAVQGSGTNVNVYCYRPCWTYGDGVPGSFLAADPTDPNVLVWVNGGTSPTSGVIDIWMSTDGFATPRPRRVQLAVPPDATGMTVESLQADARGDFFLALERCRSCPVTKFDYSSPTAATVLAFRASAVSGGSVRFGSSTLTAPGMPPLPPGERQVGAVASCAVSAGKAGSVAFDGRYVDYTQDMEVPGTIFRLDAAGCGVVPPIVLSPKDFPSGTLPSLRALSFDARYQWPDGRVGAILATAPPGFDSRLPGNFVAIYAIDPVTATTVLLTGVNTATYLCQNGEDYGTPHQGTNGACADVSFFAYDVFRKGLWSEGTQPGGGAYSDPHPGFLDLDGTLHDDCFTAIWDVYNLGNSNGANGIAAATVAGDGYLYVLWEDDQTIVKYDASTCQVVNGFKFANSQNENPREEEQLACDPISFGTPVLWVRNSLVGLTSAYPAADANCPFVTRLAYRGPAQALPGQPMTLCYKLEVALDGTWRSLARQRIDVRVAGNAVAHPLTDQSGHACITAPSPPTFGGSTVTGDFGGTAAYLPASATGIVVVPGSPGTSTKGPAGLVTSGAPPIPPPPPGPQSLGDAGTQFQADVGTQTMAQAQTQAQSQAQSQSVAQAQPGVVLQRQRHTQVAIQEQGAQMNVAYEATALRRGRPAPAVAVAAALMMLGCGLAWRRPRVALGRATRGRRRR